MQRTIASGVDALEEPPHPGTSEETRVRRTVPEKLKNRARLDSRDPEKRKLAKWSSKKEVKRLIKFMYVSTTPTIISFWVVVYQLSGNDDRRG